MLYNIVVIPDIHWGCIDPDEQLKSLEFINEFLKESYQNDIKIDLLVIAGDYFDSKLPLNSREAILAVQWFHQLYEYCIQYKVQKIRVFQGTLDHDNDQLDIFKPLEDRYDPELVDDPDYFKIFRNTTYEETLPELKCVYCPDETIQTDDYEEMYINEILQKKDIGFFHGSFDLVFGELLEAKPDLMQKKNVIYKYSLWNKTIAGPLIAGHWHDGKRYASLYYSGSPFRYKFNEDEKKGISFISYDTQEKTYFYKKILNPLCSEYITYEIYSNLCNKDKYNTEISNLQNILNDFAKKPYLNNKLKIVIYLVDDKPENDIFISSLRQHFINNKNVKITIKNKLKDKIKKEVVKRNKDRQEKFNFIYDKNKKPYEIISDFINANSEESIPIEYIKKKVQEYLK